MGFPFLTIFIIFVLWLAFKRNKVKEIQQQKEDEFWAREQAANCTLAKDITNLNYLTIPMDKFPLNFSQDTEVLAIENELKELSTHKLLNLGGISNTDLKLSYGVPNFETMCQIGEDYDRVSILLNRYAAALMEANRIDDAITVLEFAVGTKTDISDSYIRLVDCYIASNEDIKLGYLKTNIENSSLLTKNSILEHIKKEAYC
ncbi:MAG: hypothetical protein HUJ71_06085 [Pseudobutyrivibrio sp.]|nr:hypothetical protein [Pseudobutyrivibrio sp.]